MHTSLVNHVICNIAVCTNEKNRMQLSARRHHSVLWPSLYIPGCHQRRESLVCLWMISNNWWVNYVCTLNYTKMVWRVHFLKLIIINGFFHWDAQPTSVCSFVMHVFFLLQIGILMSELNNIWRDVHRGPPDPFLVIGYQSFSLISNLQVKSIIKLAIDLYSSNIPKMVT